VVAIVLSIALQALRRRSANARYIVACAGMATMFAGFVATFLLLPSLQENDANVIAAARERRLEGAQTPVASEHPIGESAALAPGHIRPDVEAAENPNALDLGQGDTGDRPEALVSTAKPKPGGVPPSLTERATSVLAPWLPWIAVGWLLGVLWFSVWNVGGWITAQRLRLVGVSPVEPDIAGRISELVQRMKVSRPVRLLRSAVVEAPITIGWLRPTILLPLGLITGLTPSELDAIIIHELAHIRRHDYLVNLLQTVIETLLFYHPAVWWVSRRIRIERENCCDDWAVAVSGDSLSYARTLTRFGELRHTGERKATVGQTVSASGGSLLSRVRRLLPGPRDDAARPRTWLAGGAILATVAFLAVMISYMSPPAGVASSATAADADADESAAWGDAFNGVQARLRAKKAVWAANETPTLYCDLRHNGRFPQSWVLRDVEVDGAWYWVLDKPKQEQVVVPGQTCSDIPFSLNHRLGHAELDALFRLRPGNHTVRARFGIDPVADPKTGIVMGPGWDVVTNPVEITVERGEEKPAATEAFTVEDIAERVVDEIDVGAMVDLDVAPATTAKGEWLEGFDLRLSSGFGPDGRGRPMVEPRPDSGVRVIQLASTEIVDAFREARRRRPELLAEGTKKVAANTLLAVLTDGLVAAGSDHGQPEPPKGTARLAIVKLGTNVVQGNRQIHDRFHYRWWHERPKQRKPTIRPSATREVVWSRAVNGLQLGVRLLRSEYGFDDAFVAFEIVLRNVTDRPLSAVSLEQGTSATMLTHDQKPVPERPEQAASQEERHRELAILKSGESINVRDREILSGYMISGGGRYLLQIEYEVPPEEGKNLDWAELQVDGKDLVGWTGKLVTQVPFTIDDRGVVWGESLGMQLASGYVGEKIRFGPVVERELRDGQFFDFATGRICTPPADLDLDDRAALSRWSLQSGADLRFVFDRATRKVQFVNMWTAYVDHQDPNQYWSDLDPEGLRKSVNDGWWASERLRLQEPAEMTAEPSGLYRVLPPSALDERLPGLVHIFMTHNGLSQGVLQVTEFTKDPPGVNIRYRLLVTKEEGKDQAGAQTASAPFVMPEAAYKRALESHNSTGPRYVLVTIANSSTGESREACIEPRALLGAIHREKGYARDTEGWNRTMAFALQQKDRTFRFSDPEAYKTASPRYTPEILAEVRQRMKGMSTNGIVKEIGDQQSDLYRFCVEGREWASSYLDSVAHVLMERSIACGRSCKPGLLDVYGKMYEQPAASKTENLSVRLKIEANPLDNLPGGLYAVGPFDVGRGQSPDAHLLYQWRIEKKIGDGYEQLVGRLPLNVYGLGSRGGGSVEVLKFTCIGNRVSGTLKYTLPLKGAKLPANSIYLRAFLPKLSAGEYEVEISFEEHYQTGDGKAGPAPAGTRPQMRPMTCKFQVPDTDPVAALKKLTAAVGLNDQGKVMIVSFARSSSLVTDTDLVHLDGLRELKVLYVHGRDITDRGLVHLKRLLELEELSLRGTGVTDAGLEHLIELAKLRKLDLRDTHVTEEGVKKLTRALPNVRVDSDATSWGEAVDRVQIALRAEKLNWRAGEIPKLTTEVRKGERKIVFGWGDAVCELEFDGQWYYLGIDDHPVDRITLNEHWLNKNDKRTDRRLPLEPGKHTVRVVVTGGVDGKGVRAVSNPVEIIIERGLPGGGPLSEPSRLPGSRLSIEQAVNRWTAFAVACEATKEPKEADFAHLVPGSARKFHRYRWDVALSNRRGPSEPFLCYRVWTLQDGPERPVAQGERVIWIGINPNPGNYRGVKALPDTPENRQAVRAAFAKRPASANKYVAFPERANVEEAARRIALLKRNLDTFRFVFRPMLQPKQPARFVALRVAEGEDSSGWEKPSIRITRQQATRIIDHLAAEGLFFRRAGNVIRDAAFEPDVNGHTIWLIDDESDPASVFVEQIQYGKDERIRALRDVLEGDARDAVDKLLSQLESAGRQEDLGDKEPNPQDAVLQSGRTTLAEPRERLRTSLSPLKLLASDVKYDGEALQAPPDRITGEKIIINRVAYYRAIMEEGLVAEDLATNTARAYRMFDLAIAAGWYEREGSEHLPQGIRGLYRQGNRLWMGSNGVGVLVYDTKTRTWSRYPLQDAPVPGFHVTVLYGDADYVFATYGYRKEVPSAELSLHVYSTKHERWLRIVAVPARDALRLGTSEGLPLKVARGWDHRRFADQPYVPIGGEETSGLAHPDKITRRPDGLFLLRSGHPDTESSWTDLVIRPVDLQVDFEHFASVPTTGPVASREFGRVATLLSLYRSDVSLTQAMGAEDAIRPGDSKQKVIGLLGQPRDQHKSEHSWSYFFAYGTPLADSTPMATVTVWFDGDKVRQVKVWLRPSRDTVESAKERLKPGATAEQVRKQFGRPSRSEGNRWHYSWEYSHNTNFWLDVTFAEDETVTEVDLRSAHVDYE